MACKRTAGNDLNHENWNNKEPTEDAGTFRKASKEVLENRVVKAARRRLPLNSDGTKKNAFGTFTGFKTATSNSSPFSFLTNAKKDEDNESAVKMILNKNVTINGSSDSVEKKTDLRSKEGSPVKQDRVTPESVEDNTRIFKTSSTYYAKLKGLNVSVAQWIKSHVDSNPFCILTPIFKDYEKYLDEIEAERGHSEEEENVKESIRQSSDENNVKETSESKETKSENPVFKNTGTESSSVSSQWKVETSIFGSANNKSIFGNTGDGKGIFGNLNPQNNPFLSKPSNSSEDQPETDSQKSEEKSQQSNISQNSKVGSIFSFGQSSAASTASAGFSFGSSIPFSFGSQVIQPLHSEEVKESEDKEEDEEPPKPEFKRVTEEGAIYEQRCKVFVKKDSSYSDKGVGTLFLKPTPKGKTQLIVRANDSLGNLLINTLLTENIPTKRMTRNSVMMVCLPLPDAQPPPTLVLLRVKTTEDADALLEILEKHKK
ncbi:nuclear pore complex protein Nup50 [Orussus abietinus]|uniref:nuclear pore complex protein Nup50 n=1 Tax=Orussus abietinus TaxID=222816 RepID=UPI0006251B8C|nr:nuclear pore complex protein Nup50 [Orussus abietinus]